MHENERWHQERKLLEVEAKKFGHVPTVSEVSLYVDGCSCSCGWKSREYWDGAEYAYDDWKKHAREAIASGQVHLPMPVPNVAPDPLGG